MFKIERITACRVYLIVSMTQSVLHTGSINPEYGQYNLHLYVATQDGLNKV